MVDLQLIPMPYLWKINVLYEKWNLIGHSHRFRMKGHLDMIFYWLVRSTLVELILIRLSNTVWKFISSSIFFINHALQIISILF